MAKTKKQGENSACSALFEHAYYSSGYGKLNFGYYQVVQHSPRAILNDVIPAQCNTKTSLASQNILGYNVRAAGGALPKILESGQ